MALQLMALNFISFFRNQTQNANAQLMAAGEGAAAGDEKKAIVKHSRPDTACRTAA